MQDTHDFYRSKIQKAQEYICQNLSQNPSLRQVAQHCAFIEYHFHRVFLAVVGETLGDYTSRKKMEKGICLLLSSRKSLIDISFDSGFSSQANFSKAFKNYFGMSPNAVRKRQDLGDNSKIGKLFSRYGKEFLPQSLYDPTILLDEQKGLTQKEIHMKAEIKTFPKREYAALQSKKGYDLPTVYATWEEVHPYLKGQGQYLEATERFYLAYDKPNVTPEDKYRYEACYVRGATPSDTERFRLGDLPEGKYACFRLKGTSKQLVSYYQDIYSNCFVKTNNEPDDYPMIEYHIGLEDHEDIDKRIVEIELQVKLK